MSTSTEAFVTVAEAARALGLSERQARRRAAVLEATGRTRTDGRTRLVTVADMMTVRPDADKKRPSGDAVMAAPSVATSQETTGRTDGHKKQYDDDDRTDARNDRTDTTALVNQLRSELESVKQDREHWRGQAEKALQLVDQAQQLQLVAERKVAELEGKLLPAMEQIEASGLPDGSQSSPSVSGTPSSLEGPRRGFLSFLRRWW